MQCFYLVNFRLFVLLIISLLTSCTAIIKSGSEQGAGSSDGQSELESNFAKTAPSTNNATLSLLDNALLQTEAGNLEAAAATIERALRIEPRNPRLWYRLALIRFDQGKHQLAANLAAKSNSFAADNVVLINKNRELIKQARLNRP